jgi:hypothetical protein
VSQFRIFKEDIKFGISKVSLRFLVLLQWKQPQLNDCRLIIKGLFDNFIRYELYQKNDLSILAPSNTNLIFVLKIQLFSFASAFVITDGRRERHESDKRRKGMMKTRKK